VTWRIHSAAISIASPNLSEKCSSTAIGIEI
jgi:hypothetical protein